MTSRSLSRTGTKASSPGTSICKCAERARGSVAIHTIFDRPLFRPGETVHMKHLVRVPTVAGFRMPSTSDLPKSPEIEHLGSGQKFKLQASFDARAWRKARGPFRREAKLGTYRIAWPGSDIQADARFRVEAFRVPLMRAVLAPPKEPLVKPATANLDADRHLSRRRAARNLPVKIRYRVEERAVQFRDYAGLPVRRHAGERSGRNRVRARTPGPRFDTDDENAADATQSAGATVVRTLTLDAAGTAKLPVDKLPVIDRAGDLLVEMEFSDPNGEIAGGRDARGPASGRPLCRHQARRLGGERKRVRAQLVALDPAGKPLAERVRSASRSTNARSPRTAGG